MKTAIIIPARFGSTRLEGKPLLKESGKPLIQHVYEQAQKSERADIVAVATDDQRIFDAVRDFGGEAIMTRVDHESGSSRVAEAAEALGADIIVNLQGDEPEIDPGDLDLLIDLKARDTSFAATLACRFPDDAISGAGAPSDPAAVKVILGAALSGLEAKADPKTFRAVYFTRSLCPFPVDEDGAVIDPARYFLHVGVYAFSKESLKRFAAAPQGALEKIEHLEQLRILEMGEGIAVGLVKAASPGIDTREDYDAFLARLAGGKKTG